MTQDVQPLTWSRRTNLEEHQQFFSKINEIIANLAPTVDEAEAAIAQATQAITNANAAIATANAASAAASAAASQAQTAASTVAGYDTRLTAAEGGIDALQGRMTAAESKNSQQDTAISALQAADAQNVKLAGNQGITGIKTVPLEATGTYSNQIASSQKVRKEIDNYCLKLTDNQVFSGIKRTNTGAFVAGASGEDRRFVYMDNNLDVANPPSANTGTGKYCWRDKNDVLLGDIGLAYLANGTTTIFVRVRNSDGTIKNVTLAIGDVI